MHKCILTLKNNQVLQLDNPGIAYHPFSPLKLYIPYCHCYRGYFSYRMTLELSRLV